MTKKFYRCADRSYYAMRIFLKQVWILRVVFFRSYKQLSTNLDINLSKLNFINVNIYEYSTNYYASSNKQTEKVVFRIKNKYI